MQIWTFITQNSANTGRAARLIAPQIVALPCRLRFKKRNMNFMLYEGRFLLVVVKIMSARVSDAKFSLLSEEIKEIMRVEKLGFIKPILVFSRLLDSGSRYSVRSPFLGGGRNT